jgi:hypothetical protein
MSNLDVPVGDQWDAGACLRQAPLGGCRSSFPPGLKGKLFCEVPVNVILFIIIIVRTSSDYMTGRISP